MKKNKRFYVLLIVSIILLAVILTVKPFQNDTFYTIKVGEQIFKTGVDMKEHFSFIGNLSYTYPHWLYDAFIYSIYNFFGFAGIYVSTIVLTIILLSVMYVTVNNLVKDRGLSYSLVILLGFTLKEFITARAQLVSYILLLLIIYFIEKLRDTNKKKYSVYILISAILIANLHTALWPFVFVLFLPFLVSDIVYFIKEKNKDKLDKYIKERNLTESRIEVEEARNTKTILYTFIITIFTGFLTPNRFVSFTYFIKTNMGITMEHISEHLPTTIDKRPELFIILGILIFILLQSDMKIKLRDLFFIVGLSLLAFMSKRSYALFAILSLFSIARILKTYLDKRMIRFNLVDVFNNKVIFTVLLLLFTFSVLLIGGSEMSKVYVNKTKYPKEASEFILENLDVKNIRIYNEYNFGSYLLYKGIPVFIDSRADLYTEEFNPGCEVFKDGIGLFKRYKEVFRKYDITHVIIYNTNKLKLVLDMDANFESIYRDDYFTVYEKLTT